MKAASDLSDIVEMLENHKIREAADQGRTQIVVNQSK